ncbi:hypothetical protein [Frigoriglobus tundricola]|uniref:hypothetical protein n=1 Tax=Frigoriglobus tundricola TaxID=2774151 RepID=UPI00148EBE56|nr:hypothetical protein [Frigoriglobus tundricola]
MDASLAVGLRGLPGGSSLAQLLAAHRGVRNHLALPPLAVGQILGWGDGHRARTGKWPRRDSGPIPEAPSETWKAVDKALIDGHRGLPGGSSLARLLQAERGVRNPAAVPRLQCWEILFWADFHHDRTGHWPTANSGAIPEAPGETWARVDDALRAGIRGLPGGGSLARLLHRRCEKPNHAALSPLTTERVLAWADAHRSRSGNWPMCGSGTITDAPGETWGAVDEALRFGRRGLSGGSSLPQLLATERGVRNSAAVPPLTREQILTWADAHHARTGHWPTTSSGPVDGVPGETWSAVSAALNTGSRGLPGGGSLARLLTQDRGVRNHMTLPPFAVEQILAWADAYHVRTGAWPCVKSGPIPESPGETWTTVGTALSRGLRGLRGRDSLARLLARERGTRNPAAVPALSVEQIRQWVRAHCRRTGCWPRRNDGPIPEAPGETWARVYHALRTGLRGLPGGSSLAQVAQECEATPAVQSCVS